MEVDNDNYRPNYNYICSKGIISKSTNVNQDNNDKVNFINNRLNAQHSNQNKPFIVDTENVNKNHFTILHQNVQSISNKLIEIEILSNTIPYLNVFCITEHWIKNEFEMGKIIIPKFIIADSYYRKQIEHGGSMILVKESIKFKQRTTTRFLNEEKVFEHAVVEIKKPNIIIISVYHTSDSNIDNFLIKLENMIEIYKRESKPLIICGDFNIDLLKENTNKVKFMNVLTSLNIITTINSATRISNSSISALDEILVDKNMLSYTTGNFNTGFSDHNATQITLDISSYAPNSPMSKFEWKRNFHKDKIKHFNILLSKENWETIYSETNINSKYNNFINVFLHYFNTAFPYTKHNVKEKHSNSSKWLTKGILISHKRKQLLYQLSKFNKSTNFINYFKRYKKIFKNVIQAAKRLQNDTYILNAKNKGKAIWEVIKNETGNQNLKVNKEIILCQNDKRITDAHNIANMFNLHFSTVAQRTFPTHNKSASSFVPKINKNDNTIFLEPVTHLEVERIIKLKKNSFSTGHDEIPESIIKQCYDYLVEPLTDICNCSLATGTFPDKLKLSKIIPLFKKEDRLNIDNYRPISLLSGFSKILETVMYERVIKFLEKYIFTQAQNGFRKNKSTSNAFYSFIENTLLALDNSERTIGIFLDLSKAFDLVDHSILLKKLETYGIRGICYDWFKSYLSNRIQYVEIDNLTHNNANCVTLSKAKSDIINTTCGIPQGSNLGPLLFLVYVNDLPLNIPYAETVLFADDTNLIYKDKIPDELQTKITKSTEVMLQWLHVNNLALNTNKTVCINFNLTNRIVSPDIPDIKINNNALTYVNHTKFLGIWIDKNLNWKKHIETIMLRLSKACFAVRVLRYISNPVTLKTIYFSYIQSILTYGIISWGACATNELDMIFKYQKKIIRIMKQVNQQTHCKPLFKELNILPLPCLYIFETVCFIHKNQHYFKKNHEIHHHFTRKANNLHLNTTKTTTKNKSVSHRGLILYNAFISKHGNSHYTQFRNALKQFLLKHCFYTINEYLECLS